MDEQDDEISFELDEYQREYYDYEHSKSSILDDFQSQMQSDFCSGNYDSFSSGQVDSRINIGNIEKNQLEITKKRENSIATISDSISDWGLGVVNEYEYREMIKRFISNGSKLDMIENNDYNGSNLDKLTHSWNLKIGEDNDPIEINKSSEKKEVGNLDIKKSIHKQKEKDGDIDNDEMELLKILGVDDNNCVDIGQSSSLNNNLMIEEENITELHKDTNSIDNPPSLIESIDDRSSQTKTTNYVIINDKTTTQQHNIQEHKEVYPNLQEHKEEFSNSQKHKQILSESTHSDKPPRPPNYNSTSPEEKTLTPKKERDISAIEKKSPSENNSELSDSQIDKKPNTVGIFDFGTHAGVFTDEMKQSIIQMFEILQIPYVCAPGEAEAECCELQSTGVCEFIATNDSDALVFGGKKIIKNFLQSDIDMSLVDVTNFKYKRTDFIFLALLLGSDYCVGVKGVGIKRSTQILDTFKNIYSFTDCIRSGITSVDIDKNLKKLCSRLVLEPSFPRDEVIKAYESPNVNIDTPKFLWNYKDVSELLKYAKNELDWNDYSIEKYIIPAFMDQTMKENFFKSKSVVMGGFLE
ncbi:hypothetical protein QTN25_004847 [Entamoeba marina]